MDTLVTIQAGTAGRDAVGGDTTTWADLRQAWVQRRQLSGSEREQSARQSPAQAVEFWGHMIDWQDVTTAHRVLVGGLIHDMVRIDIIRSKGLALIACTAGLQ